MKLLSIILSVVFAGGAFGEARIWSLTNGKTLEAEFMTIMGDKVALKTLKGKTVKILESQLSPEDIEYIGLNSPPKLDLNASKTTRIRVFPDTLSNEIPSSQYYTFKATVKQKSSRPYPYELTLEFFSIGEEKIGDREILLSYIKEPFYLDAGSKSEFSVSSKEVELVQYVMNGELRGEIYGGFMVVITDSRGEVIAHSTKRDYWFQNIENLRKVPVRKYFDKECNRAWPTRPKRFY